MSINTEKEKLRRHFKSVRKSIVDKSQLDEKLFENLKSHVDFSEYKSVIVYVSFGIEVDTLKLIAHLCSLGISVYAPKCYPEDKSMRFFKVDGLESLIHGAYNILEPVENPQNELLDFSSCLCIVPALAFDGLGYRLGWGGGYYDRFLSQHGDIFKLGITYETCIVDTIPRDNFDISVDMVLTEKKYITIGGQDEE
jgi:5-formyltetrahydrofolate cyclo-ligase